MVKKKKLVIKVDDLNKMLSIAGNNKKIKDEIEKIDQKIGSLIQDQIANHSNANIKEIRRFNKKMKALEFQKKKLQEKLK